MLFSGEAGSLPAVRASTFILHSKYDALGVAKTALHLSDPSARKAQGLCRSIDPADQEAHRPARATASAQHIKNAVQRDCARAHITLKPVDRLIVFRTGLNHQALKSQMKDTDLSAALMQCRDRVKTTAKKFSSRADPSAHAACVTLSASADKVTHARGVPDFFKFQKVNSLIKKFHR